ncbi:MAG: SRPBCC domain-containing protein, partial [Candidatus Xenobia bacterium]
ITDLTLTRILEAPRERVFQAWTDPAQMAQWWGPKGFTAPRCEVDARPGGSIRIDMRQWDGTVYSMDGTFRELVEPERIVFTSRPLDADGKPLFEVLHEVTLADRNGKTELTLVCKVLYATAQAPQYLKGMEQGWSETLERLNEMGREMVAVRLYPASRDLVWKMWTEPEHWKQWWGPNGFTNTLEKMEVRTGGAWEFVMHGPDGRDYKNVSQYKLVVPKERIEYVHVSEPRHEVSVQFEDLGGQTRLTMRMRFDSVDVREKVAIEFGALEGQKQTLNRLEAMLVDDLTLTRTFDAPRDLVYKAWTEPERLAKWWGPQGSTVRVASLDLRPGGMFHYCTQVGDQEMWGRFVYREVALPSRLVFVNSFSDAAGGITPNPFNPGWPLEVLDVLSLVEENGKTVLTLRGGPINATAQQRDEFVKNLPNLDKGFSGTFQALADYLAQQS